MYGPGGTAGSEGAEGADPRRALLFSQMEIPWALFEYHAGSLTDEDLFWAPSECRSNVWTMHRTPAGWAPDLAEVEPDPVPVTTPAWITWHIGWWLQAATAQLTGGIAPSPEDAGWPGFAGETGDSVHAAQVIEWLRDLYRRWCEALDQVENLDSVVAFPWPEDAGKTVTEMAGWASVELMKNVAELGQLLIIRRAG